MTYSSDPIDTPMSADRALRRRLAQAELDWIVPDWDAPEDVCAFTTTRGEAEARILPQFTPAPPVLLKQVHGADVAVLDLMTLNAPRKQPVIADAAVTALRGAVCAVATADCLPVLFADRRGRAVGAAHAGWRGLAAGVLERTVEAMQGLGALPDDLVTWLGPAIGPRAFEVGRDVFDAFCRGDREAEMCFVPHREGKWLADLYALARQRLARCGVRGLAGGGLCTYSDPSRFYSYRRERAAGRMLTLIWLEPDAR